MKPETKQCKNCQKEFVIEPEDFMFYEKIFGSALPAGRQAPTWCWRCRAMRRMAFRNLRKPYKRVCAATGKDIFTLMPPSSPTPVYSYDYWASDAWDPMEYGRDYDFSKPFFAQIKELMNAVPYAPTWSHDAVNSEYSVSAFIKNCYMCFDSGYDEDAAYAVSLRNSKQCVDMVNCEHCELCYYCINTNQSFKTFYSRNCTSCSEVWFCQDCVGCSSCIGCTGLRNKSYYIFNEPYTKESYKEKLEELALDTWSGIERTKEEAFRVWKKYPVKFQHSVQAKGCSGDYIFSSSGLRKCFFAGNAQDCAYSQSIIYGPIKDSMDLTSVGPAELNYNVICTGRSANISNCSDCGGLLFSEYCFECRNSKNLFGCVSLRNKNYCILNKQYTPESFDKLRTQIIAHMNDMPYIDAKDREYKYGEFFPPEISPFGYNNTQGQEYFPLTQDEAAKFGFNWRDTEKKNYSSTITSENLPERIADVEDKILSEVIKCSGDKYDCVTAFRITKQELDFYRQLNLPLPRKCFNCRHGERVSWRNEPVLHSRKCAKCEVGIETSYAPDRPEIVYCESCYNKEVV
jgi:hypothetical protein